MIFKNKQIEKPLLADYLASRQVTNSLYEYFSIGTERDLLDKLGSDFYYLSCRDISQNECCLPFYNGSELHFTQTERICPLGIRWKRMVYNDKFGVDEAMTGPLNTDSLDVAAVLNYSLPDPEWFDFSSLSHECDLYNDKIIVGGLWSAIYGDSYRMMGYQNFLVNIALNRDLVKTLVNRLTDFYLELNTRYFEAIQGKMDIFFMGNDFGSQTVLIISVGDWHDIFYENYKRLIDLAHSYDLKVMVHSCGSIEPLLPWFIQLGVDMIDPVQITAKGMDPESLVLKYGKNICFHGAIDTQSVLPYGTPEDVKSHVRYLVRHLSEYGNYIVAPSNNFMPGTPPPNIEMVYATVKELNAS